ncbi:hypothetical protein RKD31_000636 [Streptomyces sp. SAI-163]
MDGGRLVLPLRWRGQTRSVALTRRGNELVFDGMELCGFVPIIGQTGEKTASLNAADTILLHYDQDQAVDTDALVGTLSANEPASHFLSAQRIGGEETFDAVWLRATAGDDHVCRLEVTPEAVEQGLIPKPAVPGRSPALVKDDSLAYLTVTREGIDPERPFRLGAATYGPRGEELASDLITHIDAWGAARLAVPQMTVTPSTTGAVPGHVISKPESRITLAY